MGVLYDLVYIIHIDQTTLFTININWQWYLIVRRIWSSWLSPSVASEISYHSWSFLFIFWFEVQSFRFSVADIKFIVVHNNSKMKSLYKNFLLHARPLFTIWIIHWEKKWNEKLILLARQLLCASISLRITLIWKLFTNYQVIRVTFSRIFLWNNLTNISSEKSCMK